MTSLREVVSTRLPVRYGADFTMRLFRTESDGGKDHIAMCLGQIDGKENVLARVHSECFTGEVMGSERCDCGDQLDEALRLIVQNGSGVLLYLRQEGRGIGLAQKLRSYVLQDDGADTVTANTMLGHRDDERDYEIAAEMFRLLGVVSIRLLTNNPRKVLDLTERGVCISESCPLVPTGIISHEKMRYLKTKIEKLDHSMSLEDLSTVTWFSKLSLCNPQLLTPSLGAHDHHHYRGGGGGGGDDDDARIHVTVTYAQSMDGVIGLRDTDERLILSGRESFTLTHRLRASHDAILVGIGTLLADDPRLSARLNSDHDMVESESDADPSLSQPLPIVLDSHLRTPTSARLLRRHPLIACNHSASSERQSALEAAGARIVRLPCDPAGTLLSLTALLSHLHQHTSVRSLMVEGGASVIRSFLAAPNLVSALVVTTAPLFASQADAVVIGNMSGLFRMRDVVYERYGNDSVLFAHVVAPL